MADFTSAATMAAPVPDSDAIARAERFTRERFIHAGENAASALARGTGRRLALDAALAEIDAGAKVPSTHWRRRYSLLLGLERVLSEDEPRLADGTTLNPHEVDEDVADGVDDPNAHKRFWFEHATGAGKTVAAMGFVEASRTGGILILTHRRNLVDQFNGELRDRGYGDRISPPLLARKDRADGPVTVETYQWFVRNGGFISGSYTIRMCH